MSLIEVRTVIVLCISLKNTEATYQRLVNLIFKEKFRKTMEIFVNDMVVKSKEKKDHLINSKNFSTYSENTT